MINLLHGDCLEQMKTLEDNSVDAIVSDPPYGILFMSKKWDYDVPSVEVWKEAMRVLKPGGHALIACGTRTQHRMVVNIEDAGFEIRDVVSWIHGSGFPKSQNISKAIDKAAGAERKVIYRGDEPGREGRKSKKKMPQPADWGKDAQEPDEFTITAPATEAAKQWDGWGSALKPAVEFFTLCRKPLSESTIAANVLKWGTGGINIDGCRVGTTGSRTNSNGKRSMYGGNSLLESKTHNDTTTIHNQGRFPANLIHSGEQEVLELFPETKARGNKSECMSDQKAGLYEYGSKSGECGSSANKDPVGFVGSAARFFYCPKASKKDRDEGLEGFEDVENSNGDKWSDVDRRDGKVPVLRKNTHPTVKPTALMAYLCRLITPPNGVVLDPYMGSGSTGKAAIREGFSFVGIELDPDYYEIAKARVNHEA